MTELEGKTIDIVKEKDISEGALAKLPNFARMTLYVHVDAAVDIKVEFSPDNTGHFYEIPESPLSYSSSADDVLEIGYDTTFVRFTGSNTTETTIQARGLYR